jgi:hypothetical protein
MANAKIVRSLFLALPGVEEYRCYGTPGFRVAKKFMARLWEDEKTLVLRVVDDDLREGLLDSQPEIFYVTDHYRGYPAVLIRLGKIDKARLAELLEMAWRAAAPQRLLKDR